MKTIAAVPVDDLRPGMKVAESLLDDSGRVLIPAGAEVSEGMISGLQRRGVAALSVEAEVEEDPAAREAYRADLVARLDRRFRLAGESRETRLVYQAILDFQMEHRS